MEEYKSYKNQIKNSTAVLSDKIYSTKEYSQINKILSEKEYNKALKQNKERLNELKGVANKSVFTMGGHLAYLLQ